MTAKERLQTIREIMSSKTLTPVEKLDRIAIISKANAKVGKFTLREIEVKLIEHFSLYEGAIQENTRNHEIVLARQIAHYLASLYTNETNVSIGSWFGGRGNSTVIWSKSRVENYLATDRHFNARHRDFINEFKN